jgi:hypothetical protein
METRLEKYKLGSNIDSWCGKCKMVLAHTIEAIAEDVPTRVQCNTCKSQHAYKAQAPEKKTRAATGGRRSSTKAADRYRALVSGSETVTVGTYSPKNKYAQGMVFEHPTFGRGAVITVKDGTKIEVLFENGPKTLVHAGD